MNINRIRLCVLFFALGRVLGTLIMAFGVTTAISAEEAGKTQACGNPSQLDTPVQEEIAGYQMPYSRSNTRVLDKVVQEADFHEQHHGIFWLINIDAVPNARYVRLVFDSIKSPANLSYRIRILEIPSEITVAEYPAEEFGRWNSFVTGLLPANNLQVQLVADGSAPKDLAFRLKRMVWPKRAVSIQPESPVYDWTALNTLPTDSPVRTAARSVVELHIGPSEIMEATCTGVLVSKDTVLTNNHCITKSASYKETAKTPTPLCSDVIAEFDYLNPSQRGPEARCVGVLTNASLESADLVLLKFDTNDIPKISGETRQPVQLRSASETDAIGTSVRLIHHPRGLPLVTSECRIRLREPMDLSHDCQTAQGSSGSPLFDEHFRLVAIHYQGPYPDNWTIAMMEEALEENGSSRFNKAKSLTAFTSFMINQNQKQNGRRVN